MILLLLKQIRIHQWIKNVLILAPLLFSGKLFEQASIYNSILTFFAFSFAASSIYVINDIKDVGCDRNHPIKKNRPLASGRLSVQTAAICAIVCLSLSTFLLYYIGYLSLVRVLAAYCFINILYSIYFKNVSILDCIFISIGFELRILAGCLAVNVEPSDFILVVTFFLALTLGFVKRKGELKVLNANAVVHRKVLSGYSVKLLDNYISTCSTITLVSYMFYTIDEGVIRLIGADVLKYSLVFVVYGLFRFIQLTDIDKYDGEGDPTTLIYKDRPLQFTIILFLLYVTVCYYGVK